MINFKLNDGNQMPALGYGTGAIDGWASDNEKVKDTILEAINAGYRHIDTAVAYENEKSVGKAIIESGVNRKDFFITSKVANTDHGYDETIKSVQGSLERLQTDYIDLYLIHWPIKKSSYQPTYKALEEAKSKGWVKSIGVSNFYPKDIEGLMETAQIKPAVNQLELNPYFAQKEMAEVSKKYETIMTAWSPMGGGAWMQKSIEEMPISDRIIKEIAKKHDKDSGQVILRWMIQNGVSVIPKSEKPDRIKSNFEIFDFELTADEMKQIDNLDRGIFITAPYQIFYPDLRK